MNEDQLPIFRGRGLEILIAVACITASLFGAGFVFLGDIAGNSHSRQVNLQAFDITQSYTTDTDTVGAFLNEIGIRYSSADLIEPAPETSLRSGMIVFYTESVRIFLADAGEAPVRLDFPGGTVCDLLNDAGINLGPHDRLVPHPSTPLDEGMNIEITRVRILDITSEMEIEPPLSIEPDPDAPRGSVTEVDPGTPGIAEEITRIYYRNGEESTRIDMGSRVLVEPEERITRVGTRSLPGLASRGGNLTRDVVSMVATGYDPGPISCAPFADGLTATGHIAGRGVCAVDPTVIPLGTQLWVEGYGYAYACDTGGAIKGNRIDLCFDTYNEALSYGRRTVLVYILD